MSVPTPNSSSTKAFGHGINKPKELLAATWHNWQWLFGKYIWGEDIELPMGEEEEEDEETAEEEIRRLNSQQHYARMGV